MASFNTFIPTLSVNEGGYQDNPNDTGNYNSKDVLIGTNHGISAPTLEAYLGYVPTLFAMKYLDYATAKTIFKTMFWDVMKVDNFTSQAVAETVADMGINANPRTAIKMLQKTLNNSFGNSLVVDGINGINTTTATNNANENELFVKYNQARESYYRSLSQFSIFGSSWLNRIKVLSQKFSIAVTSSIKNNNLVVPIALALATLLLGYTLIKSSAKPTY